MVSMSNFEGGRWVEDRREGEGQRDLTSEALSISLSLKYLAYQGAITLRYCHLSPNNSKSGKHTFSFPQGLLLLFVCLIVVGYLCAENQPEV